MFAIKSGTPYTVQTGYIIYEDEAAMNAGISSDVGNGDAIEMIFERIADMRDHGKSHQKLTKKLQAAMEVMYCFCTVLSLEPLVPSG